MSATIVYLDQVIIGSIIMNYSILWATGRLSGIEKSRWRLAISALLGGIYSALVFLPALSVLLTVWVKTLISMVMVFIAFAPHSFYRMIICLAFFYLASFALGGSVIGAMYFLDSRGGFYSLAQGFPWVLDQYFWYAVILALSGFWVAGRGTAALFKRRYCQMQFKMPVVIKIKDKELSFQGFIDSGNHLTDPLTGNPVIVVEYEALKEILPENLIAFYSKGLDFDLKNAHLIQSKSHLGLSFRLIPFKSLGTDSGMLIGFKPEEIRLIKDNSEIIHSNVTVAICSKKLSSDSDYHALIHPGLLNTSK